MTEKERNDDVEMIEYSKQFKDMDAWELIMLTFSLGNEQSKIQHLYNDYGNDGKLLPEYHADTQCKRRKKYHLDKLMELNERKEDEIRYQISLRDYDADHNVKKTS